MRVHIPHALHFVFLPLFLAISWTFGAEKAPARWPLLIKDTPFANIELALTPEELERGLMKRKSLAEDGGMLFVFQKPGIHKFWMKDTWIPLDVIFVDTKGVVTAIHTMTPEPRKPNESEAAYCGRLTTYSSQKPVIAAIELNAGTAASLGLEVGDTIELRLEALTLRSGSVP